MISQLHQRQLEWQLHRSQCQREQQRRRQWRQLCPPVKWMTAAVEVFCRVRMARVGLVEKAEGVERRSERCS